ncbi:MAG: hypothetical protein FWF81_12010 [Defluviitaleaceae bacterium]|nr:hypothetical protein [Defluviitaleaceae bacterium]
MKTSYFFETGGLEFECGVVDVVSAFAKREWGNKAVKFSTTQQDRHEGTDFFVLGIPIDITLAFDKKNKTRKVGTLKMDGVTIDFGVRFGNNKAKFKTPVLVIGAEAAIGISKSNMWITLGIIKDNVQKILDMGMDKYFLATDA